MLSENLKAPIVFFIFKRPDTTQKVLDCIKQAKPSKLLVVADGPRLDKAGEVEKCEATRALIDQVDWDCEVIKNYSSENLGSGKRVSTGINWAFEQVETAIFLEDDCLPHPSFFKFCDELLERYKDDTRVMSIGGTNILGEWNSHAQSYHFSYYGSIWGWASWRRAWAYYDFQMKLWEFDEAKTAVHSVLADSEQAKKMEKIFASRFSPANNGQSFDTWDYQWLFSRLINSGLSILPSVNLVSNIGFNKDATHTKTAIQGISNLETSKISFPLKHPPYITVDRTFDQSHYNKAFRSKTLLQRAIIKMQKMAVLPF
jgi:hypothetical protein